jgi:hypothetical protein
MGCPRGTFGILVGRLGMLQVELDHCTQSSLRKISANSGLLIFQLSGWSGSGEVKGKKYVVVN